MKKTNAATRHAILFFTLILVVSLMGVHWTRTISVTLANSVMAPTSGTLRPEIGSGSEIPFSHDEMDAESLGYNLMPDASDPMRLPAAEDPSRVVKESNEQSAFISSGGSKHEIVPFARALFNPIRVGFSVPGQLSIVLIIAWFGIALSKIILLFWRLKQIRSLKNSSTPADSDLQIVFNELRDKLGARRAVELRISPINKSPLLLGFRHPVILLPAKVGEFSNSAELEQILSHEIAHAERHDDWANLVQHAVQAVFFFHPATSWISRKLTLEREIACDDYALRQSGRRAYAHLLLNLAGRMQGYDAALGPGTSSNKKQLKERIDMILDNGRNRSPQVAKMRLGLMTAAATVLALAAICCAPRVVLAQNDPGQPGESPKAPVEPLRSPKAEPLPVLPPARPEQESGQPSVSDPRPVLGDLPLLPGRPPAHPLSPAHKLAREVPGQGPLEQRLARVEKMLNVLLARIDANPGEAQFHAKGPFDEATFRDKLQHEEMLRHDAAEARFKKYLKSEAQNEQARQSMNQALEAFKRGQEAQFQAGTTDRRVQLQELKRHLEMLEIEKAKVGEEIQRLEKEQEKRDGSEKNQGQ